MQQTEYAPSLLDEAANPPASEHSSEQPRRRRVRLYLVGSESETQSIIDRLQLLHFTERIEWSRVIAIPENGVLIRPDPDDVLRYLQRYRSLI